MEPEGPVARQWSAENMLKFTAALIPIVVASLFFAGLLCWWSYCSYWGISGDAFPRSFQDTVSYGVLAFMLSSSGIIKPLIWLAIFIAVVSFLSSYAARVYLPNSDDPDDPDRFKRLKIFVEWFDKLIPEEKRPTLQQMRQDNAPAAIFLMLSAGLMLIVLILSIFYLTFLVRGGKIAENQQ